MRAVLFTESRYDADRVYSQNIRKKLSEVFEFDGKDHGVNDLGAADFSDVEVLFTTWGMARLDTATIKTYFPRLKACFCAMGSVQGFAREFLSLGIKVFSAWQANAVPVVEYAVSQILLATKGYFPLSRLCKTDYVHAHDLVERFTGNYGAKIGILGDGAIGSRVIEKLKEHNLDVYVYSITMTEDKAKKSGVRLASLKTIFSECDVISNHLADNEKTRGMINGELFKSMKDYSTFINTGRGAQVDETALIEVLENNETVTAVLDVTYPEPPDPKSKLYTLDNVVLTPHIAGSLGREVERMAEYMIEESKRFIGGQSTLYGVTEKMLKTMA